MTCPFDPSPFIGRPVKEMDDALRKYQQLSLPPSAVSPTSRDVKRPPRARHRLARQTIAEMLACGAALPERPCSRCFPR